MTAAHAIHYAEEQVVNLRRDGREELVRKRLQSELRSRIVNGSAIILAADAAKDLRLVTSHAFSLLLLVVVVVAIFYIESIVELYISTTAAKKNIAPEFITILLYDLKLAQSFSVYVLIQSITELVTASISDRELLTKFVRVFILVQFLIVVPAVLERLFYPKASTSQEHHDEVE